VQGLCNHLKNPRSLLLAGRWDQQGRPQQSLVQLTLQLACLGIQLEQVLECIQAFFYHGSMAPTHARTAT
jgi:hypothetical protein